MYTQCGWKPCTQKPRWMQRNQLAYMDGLFVRCAHTYQCGSKSRWRTELGEISKTGSQLLYFGTILYFCWIGLHQQEEHPKTWHVYISIYVHCKYLLAFWRTLLHYAFVVHKLFIWFIVLLWLLLYKVCILRTAESRSFAIKRLYNALTQHANRQRLVLTFGQYYICLYANIIKTDNFSLKIISY